MPELRGIHHLKFAVGDLDRALGFYVSVFDARRLPSLDHRNADGGLYAVICDVPGLGTRLELRLNPSHAQRQSRFDPLTIAVADRAALRAWIERLDALELPHSGELPSLQAWIVVFCDPDGRRLRFYTLETHGPEIAAAQANPWLAD